MLVSIFSSVQRKTRHLGFACLGLAALLVGSPARAQVVIATINSDPVTSIDVDERVKLLRALGEPASPDAALESLIKSRLEAGEVNKFNIRVSANELAPTMNYFAQRAHVTSEVLAQRLQAAGLNKKHVENFLSIHQAFNIYAHARNRAREVGEAELKAEVERDPKLRNQQTYVLRQIVIAVQPSAGVAGLQAAGKRMEALRAKFTDCESGAKLAAEMPDVVVREPVTRTTSQLGEQFTSALDKTPVGHLTPPSRDQLGLAALALCSRKPATLDSVRELAQAQILARYIQTDADALYKELRVNAVIVKK
jgi:peptidyl-prolyl cis-trans isomerase SurA